MSRSDTRNLVVARAGHGGRLGRVLLAAALAVGAVLWAGAAAAAPVGAARPRIIAVDISPPGTVQSLAVDVNNRGEVIGNAADDRWLEPVGFRWRSGKLTVLGGNGTRVSVEDISERGHVVGYCVSGPDAAGGPCLWRRGRLRMLRGVTGGAYAVNDRGQAVGMMRPPNGEQHVFRWWHGAVRDLSASAGQTFGIVRDVNDRGQAVGQSDRGATIWGRGATIELGGGSYANDINDRGQVVGAILRGQSHRAFLWQRGKMTDLGTLGGDYSDATAVNERGQVVGVSSTASGVPHAFLWQRGRMTDLGTLGGAEASAVDINERGQIVGSSAVRSGQHHAFLWQRGRMTDLGTFGADHSGASAVNDHGVVAGYTIRNGTDTVPARYRATVWYIR